jgi:hypothetical protein
VITEVNAMLIMLVCRSETAFGTQEERSLAVAHHDDHCREILVYRLSTTGSIDLDPKENRRGQSSGP